MAQLETLRFVQLDLASRQAVLQNGPSFNRWCDLAYACVLVFERLIHPRVLIRVGLGIGTEAVVLALKGEPPAAVIKVLFVPPGRWMHA